MTKDKDFKRVVRDEAKASGRRYSAVRADLRPPTATASVGGDVDDFPATFAAIVDSVDRALLGQPDVVRLVTIGVVVGAPMLLTARAGSGRTMLARGVATAIGATPVSVNGAIDAAPDIASWSANELVLVDQYDAMSPSHQAMVMEASRQPAVLLAGRSPRLAQTPGSLDDESVGRFVFDVEIGYADEATELRVLELIRAGEISTATQIVDIDGLAAMRATAAAVDMPEDVRRFAVKAIAATRDDAALAVGGSMLATASVMQGAAVVAAADGRTVATVDDARPLLRPALAHRIAFRDGADGDVDAVVERAVTAAVER